MKGLIKIGLLLFIFAKTSGQETVSFGISGAYNFPLETTSIGIRSNIPLLDKISIAPQIRYSPQFNEIHELMAGVNLHYNLINNTQKKGATLVSDPSKPVVYLAAGVMYDRWMNYIPSMNSRAKADNILPEVGMGAALGGNLIRVFAEAKYNVLWNESCGELGLLFYPFNKRPSKLLRCP